MTTLKYLISVRFVMQSDRFAAISLIGILTVLGWQACSTAGHSVSHSAQDTSSKDHSFYREYSEFLGIKLSGKEDKKLLIEVKGWIGVPYKYAGNDKNGTDCSGFTSNVYKKIYNINLCRSSADQVKNTDPIDKKDLRCGDLVFFKIKQDKVSHVGLYISDNKFIHASVSKGVVVDDLDEEYYKRYYYSAGRVKGMPDK